MSTRGEPARTRGVTRVAEPGATLRLEAVPLEQTRALRHEVLRDHADVAETLAAEPAGAIAMAAYDGALLVSTGLIARDPDRPGVWRVRGMATRASARGRGAGAAVLAALLDIARADGAHTVWCNARTSAVSLYERAGFVVTSEEFELPDIGPHVVMELALAAAGSADTT